MTNSVPTNVMSTVSVNSDDKKVRFKIDCYIHTILLVIITLLLLLVVISIGCYYYYPRHQVKKHIHCRINIK